MELVPNVDKGLDLVKAGAERVHGLLSRVRDGARDRLGLGEMPEGEPPEFARRDVAITSDEGTLRFVETSHQRIQRVYGMRPDGTLITCPMERR